MPVYTSSIEVTADYPTIKPSLNLNFARSRSLDPRITFTRASAATYIGRDGLVKYAGEDEARFDHDPNTLESLGLLIEESRTNVLANSGQISLTQSWAVAVGANQTVTPNAVVAPDGTTTGTRFTTNTPTGSNIQWIYQNNNGSYSNVTVTGSFWARADATKTLLAHITDGIAGSTYSYTVTTEWQRFSFTKTCNNGAGVAGLYPIFITNEPAGLNVYLWGAQLEVGSFATSYIPTSGSSVTRAKDTATILGESFDSFYNTQEWTVLCDFKLASLEDKNGNCRVWDINNNTNNGRIGLLYDTGNFPSFFGFDAGAVQLSFSVPAISNLNVKTALGWSPTSAAGYYDGTLVGTDNTSTTYAPTQFQIGDWYNDDRSMNGTISKLVYYGKRLTNAQLQQLTS